MSLVGFMASLMAMEEHFLRADTVQASNGKLPAHGPVVTALSARGEAEFTEHVVTCVRGELEGPAEVSIPCCCPGPHVEHVGGQGVEAFDVGVSGRRFHDAIAALILVLPAGEQSGDGVKMPPCTLNLEPHCLAKTVLMEDRE